MIITILIAVIFFALLAKAIVETIWGSCLVIYGFACQTLAFGLRLLAKAIRICGKIKRKREPKRLTLGESFMLVNAANSREAKRILVSLR
jgi:CII-binding regulator of phage lambda lysogenization HflD